MGACTPCSSLQARLSVCQHSCMSCWSCLMMHRLCPRARAGGAGWVRGGADMGGRHRALGLRLACSNRTRPRSPPRLPAGPPGPISFASCLLPPSSYLPLCQERHAAREARCPVCAVQAMLIHYRRRHWARLMEVCTLAQALRVGRVGPRTDRTRQDSQPQPEKNANLSLSQVCGKNQDQSSQGREESHSSWVGWNPSPTAGKAPRLPLRSLHPPPCLHPAHRTITWPHHAPPRLLLLHGGGRARQHHPTHAQLMAGERAASAACRAAYSAPACRSFAATRWPRPASHCDQ